MLAVFRRLGLDRLRFRVSWRGESSAGKSRRDWRPRRCSAFFLIFYLPAAVIALAPDLIMLAPHLAAIYFALFEEAVGGRALRRAAFWVNAKGLFVLLTCAVIMPELVLLLVRRFLFPARWGPWPFV